MSGFGSSFGAKDPANSGSESGGLFGGGGFDDEKLARLMMGLALLDAGRPQVNPPSMGETVKPFMGLLGASAKRKEEKANQDKLLKLFGDTIKGAPPLPGMDTGGDDIPTGLKNSLPNAPGAISNAMPDGSRGGITPKAAAVGTGSPVDTFLDLTAQLESGGRNIMQQVVGPGGGYNPSTGTVTGPSSAQGYYQITNSTWKDFAPTAGVDTKKYPTAMTAPPDVQRQVARTIATTSGVQHWTNYNDKLRSAVSRLGLPVKGPIADEPMATTDQVRNAMSLGAPPANIQPLMRQADNSPVQMAQAGPPTMTDATVGQRPFADPGATAAVPTPQIVPPTPQQLAQARAIVPQTAPPPSPETVTGAKTQKAIAAQSIQYWTRAMMAAGLVGAGGKGIMEAAKANIDISKGYLTPTEQQKNVEAAFPGNRAMQQQALRNALTDNSPEHAGAVAGATEAAKLPYDLYKTQQQKELELRYGPQTAGATELARRQAGLAVMPQEESIKTQAEIAKAQNTPTASMKDYDAYVADTQKRGQQPLSMFDWHQANLRSGATNVQQRVEGQGQAALVNAGIKQMETAFEGELAANKRTQLYGQMAEALQGFTPGATAEVQLRGESLLKDLGVIKGEHVPPAEIFRQAARHIQITAAPKGQGAVSNFERELFAEAVPNMTQSPEAVAQAINIARRLDDYDRQVAKIHRDVARSSGGLPNPIEAQERIAAMGPPLSQGEMNALNSIREGARSGAGQATPGDQPATPQQAAPNPPKVFTKSDWDKLGPGTVYIDPTGTLRTKGGR